MSTAEGGWPADPLALLGLGTALLLRLVPRRTAGTGARVVRWGRRVAVPMAKAAPVEPRAAREHPFSR